jgi:hypothetical protein
MADWLDTPDEEEEGTAGIASALADPRGTFADSKGSVPDATPQIHEGSPTEAHNAGDAEADNGDYETSMLANPKPAEQQQGNGEGSDEDMAPFLAYDNNAPDTPGPASAIFASPTAAPAANSAAAPGADDPYADFKPQAPQVPQAPQLPSADDARDQLAHQIASFDPNQYKPSVGRRIGAAVAAGLVGFGSHNAEAGLRVGQAVNDAPLNHARAEEQQKELALNQQIANTEQNRRDAQQDYQNRVSDYNMQERGMTNSARVADWQALAQQRKATAQQKLAQVDPRTLGPVDQNNPFGEWQGKNAKGEVIRGLEPPPAVQKDPRYIMQQRRNDISDMARMGIQLTSKQKAHYLAGDKTLGDARESISIRENPDGSPVAPRTGGKGGANPDAEVSALVAKSVRDKDAFTNKYQRNSDGSYAEMGDNGMETGRGLTGQEFNARVDKFRTDANKQLARYGKAMDEQGNIVAAPTANGGTPMGSQPAPAQAAPQQQPAQQPQQAQPLVKAGNGQQLTDKSLAAQYLQKAGGDKGKARALASKDGWKF